MFDKAVFRTPRERFTVEPLEKVLIALRKIIRATDLHSKYLGKTTGLTAPQILLMQCIQQQKSPVISQVAKDMNLSLATVSAIVDRLETREYVVRKRIAGDKRKVCLELTATGVKIVKKAPPPLQDRFSQQFACLAEWEQNMLLASLQKVAMMMDAENLDASPVLDLGVLDRSE